MVKSSPEVPKVHQKTETQPQDYRTLPLPTLHHTTKGLFTTVPFTWYSTSSYQEKMTRHTKMKKTQFEETDQTSEPDMARMLELSDGEFKTAVINMVSAL